MISEDNLLACMVGVIVGAVLWFAAVEPRIVLPVQYKDIDTTSPSVQYKFLGGTEYKCFKLQEYNRS